MLSDRELQRLNDFHQVIFLKVLRIIREKMLQFDSDRSDLQLLIVPLYHPESGICISKICILYMKYMYICIVLYHMFDTSYLYRMGFEGCWMQMHTSI